MNVALFSAVIMLSAATLFIGIRLAGRLPAQWVTGVFALTAILFVAFFALRWFHWIVGDILILLLSISAGKILDGMIKSRQALIVFCLTLAIMDLASFYFGPTASLVKSYREGNTLLLQYLSICIPTETGIQPIMGIGDTMALATTYAILIQLRYPGGWAFLVPLAGFLIAMAVGLQVGGIFALPFLAGALIVYIVIDQRVNHRGNP
ncbi:MAG: hypothetical protein WBM17_14440 [Anaerolineales bacterium]